MLRRAALRTAARRGATVLVGTHVDLQAEAETAGLTVDTLRLTAVTADDLVSWAARRFAAVGAGPCWALPRAVAEDVADLCGASWRVAGDLLHAWFAGEISRREP